MNIAFSKIIKIDERNREFNFRKLPADYLSYHVDVTDDRGGRILFSMYKSADGVWRATSNRLPLWIAASESLLGGHIEESEAALILQKKGLPRASLHPRKNSIL
jgi:hypothetical protein